MVAAGKQRQTSQTTTMWDQLSRQNMATTRVLARANAAPYARTGGGQYKALVCLASHLWVGSSA